MHLHRQHNMNGSLRKAQGTIKRTLMISKTNKCWSSEKWSKNEGSMLPKRNLQLKPWSWNGFYWMFLVNDDLTGRSAILLFYSDRQSEDTWVTVMLEEGNTEETAILASHNFYDQPIVGNAFPSGKDLTMPSPSDWQTGIYGCPPMQCGQWLQFEKKKVRKQGARY